MDKKKEPKEYERMWSVSCKEPLDATRRFLETILSGV